MTLVARLRAYLLAGIIVSAPFGITLLIVWEVVRYFDTTVATFLPAGYNPETYLPFSLPGIGFLMMLGFLILIGWFAAGLVGRTVMRTGERVLDRTPVVRAIYGTLKQIFQTVLAQSSRAFREVVLVEFPRPGAWAMGFVTGQTSPELRPSEGGEFANVLVPMSPFPSSGFLLFVPVEDLVRLDMTVEEGMRIILSGGIVAPSDLPKRPGRSRAPLDAAEVDGVPEPDAAALEKVEERA